MDNKPLEIRQIAHSEALTRLAKAVNKYFKNNYCEQPDVDIEEIHEALEVLKARGFFMEIEKYGL